MEGIRCPKCGRLLTKEHYVMHICTPDDLYISVYASRDSVNYFKYFSGFLPDYLREQMPLIKSEYSWIPKHLIEIFERTLVENGFSLGHDDLKELLKEYDCIRSLLINGQRKAIELLAKERVKEKIDKSRKLPAPFSATQTPKSYQNRLLDFLYLF